MMENGITADGGRGGGDEDGMGHMGHGAEFAKVHSVIVDGGDRFGVSTITFDLQEELIWMGNQGGHVTSYYGNSMEKYTSFQVHASHEIRQILTFDELVLILSQSQLRGQVRRGLPIFTHTAENMRDVQCMLQTSPNTLLMGGHQEDLIEFDVNTGTQTNVVQLTDSGCAILRSQGRLICTGEPTGQIHLLDSRTFRKEQTLEAHSGSLSDFDVHGNLMVTCGFSARHGNLAVDRFIKVYDIRIMRALAPIPVSVDPFLLRFLPSFSSRIAALSPSGQMEILETQAVSQANICLYQVTTNASMSLSFDVSSSCHHLAFGDSGGNLHLFASNPSATFNSFSRNTEFPEPIETYPTLNFSDELASFGTIPFPFSTTPALLSDWPPEYCTPVYRKIPIIEPNILQSVKTLGTAMSYAPNPGNFRRNQMRYSNNMSGESGSNSLNNNFFSGKPMSPIPTSSSGHNGNMNNNNNSHGHGGPDGLGPLPPHKQNGHMGGPGPVPFGPMPPHQGPNGMHNHNHGHSPVNMKHHHHQQGMNNHPPPPPPHHFPHSPHHHGPGPGHHNHMPPPPQFYYQGPPPPPHGQGPPGPPGMMPPGPGGHPGPRPYFQNQKPGPFMKNTFYPGKRGSYHGTRYQLPKRYTKYDWKKNFFEESDMESFNRTKFPGLEATQANAYSNSLLQILYHIDYLRVRLISHLCDKEACLSCELGFLFHMMDKTRVIPCIASNFLRAFRLVPEASALGLILQESQSKQRGTFLRLIQSFNRFILHQIEAETSKSAEEGTERSDPVSQLFAMKQENVNRCTRCGREEKKESTVLLSNLLYSPDATGGGKRCKFVELLQKSLCPERTTPAWCEKCGKYQSTFQSRVPKALPPFLSLNTCLDNPHDFQLWRNHLEAALPEKGLKPDGEMLGSMGSKGPPLHQKSCRYGKNCMRPDCKFWHEGRGMPVPQIKPEHGMNVKMTEFEVNPENQMKWLPHYLRVVIEERRRVTCVDLDEHERVGYRELPKEAVRDGVAADYELVAVTCFIRDGDTEEKNNLVSLVQVDPAYFQRAGQPEGKSNWFIFNDFCVREIPVAEAYSFNPKWKIPCVVYYRKKMGHMPKEIVYPPEIIPTVTIDIFTNPEEGRDGKTRKVTYKPLDLEEIPAKGDLVAMDAEFVTLGQEETELRSDGKLATVKPQQMTVARVTCIRGQGELEGTPFIDDYISTQEVVVDYLTKFSGIQPGDLDVNFSSKNITMLKMVYLKMRFLIDSGVKFVGHGLNNDFRVINLIVPADQIVDTVALFYLPNQRMISLRFLAWHFLGLVIQSEVHDSTEDARTALQLYRKYEELKRSGQLEKALEDLYETGKKAQWKVPSEQQPQPPPPVSK